MVPCREPFYKTHLSQKSLLSQPVFPALRQFFDSFSKLVPMQKRFVQVDRNAVVSIKALLIQSDGVVERKHRFTHALVAPLPA